MTEIDHNKWAQEIYSSLDLDSVDFAKTKAEAIKEIVAQNSGLVTALGACFFKSLSSLSILRI